MSQSNQIEVVASDNNACGEAPLWDAARSRLLWDDIGQSLVYQLNPATGEKTILCRDLMVAGIALNRDGSLVFAGENGVHLWRGPDAGSTLVDTFEGETLFFNDILADAAGRLYAGTAYWGDDGMEKTGKLYIVEGNGNIRVVDEGLQMPNGLALSPDNRVLYFADSAARIIYAYDVQSDGGLQNKRVLVQVPREEGLPDGLTVDAEGFIWSAQWYGAQIVRYDPDGKVERRIAMPAVQISSVAFGGSDLTDLYVTSAGEAWPSDLMPPGCDLSAGNVGGSLYRIRTDIAGKAEHCAALG